MNWTSGLLGFTNQSLLRALRLRLIRQTDIDHWHPLSRLAHPEPGSSEPFSPPFLKSFFGRGIASLQRPADIAIVIQTMLRPSLVRTVKSIFSQQFSGFVQTVIGIDVVTANWPSLDEIFQAIPDRHSVLVLYPGYSTSRRHGGTGYAWDGGNLRTILSYIANSRFIAYVDDDNWYAPNHLADAHAILSNGADWAWSRRWFVHPKNQKPICEDIWESTGPGYDGFFSFLGGWVDPNCLVINKITCEAVLRWWSIPLSNPMNADRNVFRVLSSEFRGADTGSTSVFYVLSESDSMHPHRLKMIGEDRYAEAGRLT